MLMQFLLVVFLEDLTIADVTLKRWDGAEDKVGGPGTYGCPFHQAALEAEAAGINGSNVREL
jgi:hypothetical protein